MSPPPVEVSVEPTALPRTTALLNNCAPDAAVLSVFTIAPLSWIVPVPAVTVNAPRSVVAPMSPSKITLSAAFTVKVCVPKASASIVLTKVMSPPTVEVSVEPTALPRTTWLLYVWSPVVPAIALTSVATDKLLRLIVPPAVTVNEPSSTRFPTKPASSTSTEALDVNVCAPVDVALMVPL